MRGLYKQQEFSISSLRDKDILPHTQAWVAHIMVPWEGRMVFSPWNTHFRMRITHCSSPIRQMRQLASLQDSDLIY